LAKELGLEYIDLEGGILRIFKKIKDNEDDPKLDEEGNKVEILNKSE
jgi:adenylate/nucleoside-diphosphate kinase